METAHIVLYFKKELPASEVNIKFDFQIDDTNYQSSKGQFENCLFKNKQSLSRFCLFQKGLI